MRLSIPFKRFNDLNERTDEFDIDFNPKENGFEKLVDFIQEYEHKRVNVKYTGTLDIKTARALSKVGGNVYFRLAAHDISAIDVLKEGNCRYFFGNDVPAYNLTFLAGLAGLGVSDVYIKDDLWYNLPDAAKSCHDYGIAVRAVLNRIPSTAIGKGNDPRDMFLRPSDLPLLEGFVDTVEFDCKGNGTVYDFAKADVLYKTWFESGAWYGDLREINDDLKLYVPNTGVFPQLTSSKLTCGLACRRGLHCKKCEQFIEIAKSLSEKKISVK